MRIRDCNYCTKSCSFCVFAEFQREGARQAGGVHNDDGGGALDLPQVRQGQTNPADAAGQVRGARRIHEQGHAAGDQTEDEDQPRGRAAALHRRTPHWGKHTFYLTQNCHLDFYTFHKHNKFEKGGNGKL